MARLLLRDLLDDPALRLSLLTGQRDVDRVVRGVYITDLIDPRRYLDGGELVLSGLVWHDGSGSSERFVTALVEAGVAGLGAGAARLGHVPADLVEACRRHGLPLFEVPVAVSFTALADRVQHRDSLRRRELISAVAAGADLGEVLTMASAELEAECWVLSATGWTVGGTADLAEESRRELVRAAIAERLPASAGAGGAFLLRPVDSGAAPRAARWVLAIRAGGGRWGAEQEATTQDLGTAVALVRSRVDQAREIAARPVESAFLRLLDGTATQPELAAHLETAGLPTGEPLRVAVLQAGDRGASTALLREIAAATGLASVAAPFAEGATALFVDDADHLAGLEDRLRGIVADIEPGLAGRALSLGLSDISPPKGLRGALEEAGYARRLAAQRPGRARVATGAELNSHEALLACVPDELRRAYRDRLLAGLFTYDREHQSDLVGTLRTFLEASGSWSRCAQELHIHVNTLRYRVGRIEDITGRDLADLSTRVDLYLALALDPRHRPRR